MFCQGVNSDGEPLRSMYVVHADSVSKGLDCSHDGRTRQEYADDCDINILLARYEKSGVFTHYNANEPQYLDVSAVPDLQESLAYLKDAQRAFMMLPAEARREFDNDPVKFVEYASAAQDDPDKLERMRAWKLAPPAPVEPAPIKVEVTNPAPEKPSVPA